MSWNASVGIPLAIAGAFVFASIYWFGRPRKPGQGRRKPGPRESGDRIEPTFGDEAADDDQAHDAEQGELAVGMHQNRVESQMARREPALIAVESSW